MNERLTPTKFTLPTIIYSNLLLLVNLIFILDDKMIFQQPGNKTAYDKQHQSDSQWDAKGQVTNVNNALLISIDSIFKKCLLVISKIWLCYIMAP